MSAGQHWLGDAELWGLTPGRFAEIRDELDDHVASCRDSRHDARAAELRQSLTTRQARRKLSAPHIADQVYATINRWPLRREWIEFGWLALWYVLILAADGVAIWADSQVAAFDWHGWRVDSLVPESIALPASCAWLAQGIARAGFYATFAVALYRAWQIGWGVLIGRILQLKLIHTLLVLGGAWLLRGQIASSFDGVVLTHQTGWPTWLTAPVVAVPLVLLAIGIFVLSRRRAWAVALAALLLAAFLYPGGPARMQNLQVSRPLVYKVVRDANGDALGYTPVDNPAAARERAGWWAKVYGVIEVNAEENYLTEWRVLPAPLFGHMLSWKDPAFDGGGSTVYEFGREWHNPNSTVYYGPRIGETIVASSTRLVAPLYHSGAGLGWIAAAIPLLGICGLVGLLLVMGRRGVVECIVYTLLCLIALVFTVGPCLIYPDFSPRGVVMQPFPAIALLLTDATTTFTRSAVYGFVFSAGVPWLLAWLFLTPRGARRSVPDSEGVVA